MLDTDISDFKKDHPLYDKHGKGHLELLKSETGNSLTEDIVCLKVLKEVVTAMVINKELPKPFLKVINHTRFVNNMSAVVEETF